MPHSTHEADGKPNGVAHSASNATAQANGAHSSQTIMLDRWANETLRDELPLNEVMQQPDAESSARD